MATRPVPSKLLRAPKQPDFQQERAKKSYLALLQAAGQLFATHSYDEVGTPEIAQRAGVSTGTFYRYFEDKQQIYLEVTRSTLAAAYTDTVAQLTPAALSGLARHETIRHTLSILFGHILDRPRLSLSFWEMALRDPAVAKVRREFDELSISMLTELITAIVPRSVVPDPAATAYVVYISVMQTALSLSGAAGGPMVDPERAKKALADFLERALFPG